jgi:hypothetical protein
VALEVLKSLAAYTQGVRRIVPFSGSTDSSPQEVKSKSETAGQTWGKLDPLG